MVLPFQLGGSLDCSYPLWVAVFIGLVGLHKLALELSYWGTHGLYQPSSGLTAVPLSRGKIVAFAKFRNAEKCSALLALSDLSINKSAA